MRIGSSRLADMNRNTGAWLVLALAIAACGPAPVVPPSAGVPSLPPPIASPSASPQAPSATPSAAALSYALTCGPVERTRCESMARSIVAAAGKRVVALRIFTAKGDYTLTFDDGTSLSLVVD